jgi:regulator of cell morphogenesis and NO signaling
MASHHPRSRTLLLLLGSASDACSGLEGPDHPGLSKVRDALRLLGPELLEHLDFEERELFPVILDREKEGRALPPIWGRETGLVEMHRQHDHAQDLFGDLRILTQDYQPPPGADPRVARLYDLLKELDEDLELHIELENRWLFSRGD